jgi:hypothetical protein
MKLPNSLLPFGLLVALLTAFSDARAATAEQATQAQPVESVSNSDSPPSSSSGKEKDPGTPAESTKRPASGKPAEVFVPTEEISEDFAVSFPVDI